MSTWLSINQNRHHVSVCTLTCRLSANLGPAPAPLYAAPPSTPILTCIKEEPATIADLWTLFHFFHLLRGQEFYFDYPWDGTRHLYDAGRELVAYRPDAPSPRIETWLRSIPGAVLVALVAPTVLASSLAETLAALATVLVAVRTRNVLLSIVVGVGEVWTLRMVK